METSTRIPVFARLLFAGVSVGMAWWLFSSLWASVAAQSWIVTPARILEARLSESDSSDNGTTYRVEARYAYTFAGRSYEGTRVSFYGGYDNIGSFQRDAFVELSRHLPVPPPSRRQGAAGALNPHSQTSKPFRCFVNPRQPGQAVLYRNVRVPMLAIQLVFVLMFGRGAGFGPIICWIANAAGARR